MDLKAIISALRHGTEEQRELAAAKLEQKSPVDIWRSMPAGPQKNAYLLQNLDAIREASDRERAGNASSAVSSPSPARDGENAAYLASRRAEWKKRGFTGLSRPQPADAVEDE